MVFDSAEGNAKPFRNLLFRQIVEIAHPEHFLATRRQTAYGLFDYISQIGIENAHYHRIVIRGIIIPDNGRYLFFIFIAERVGQFALLKIIHAPVIYRAYEITLQVGSVILQFGPILPNAEKNILNYILGPILGQEKTCIRNKPRETSLAKLVKRTPVTFTDPAQNIFLLFRRGYD